MQSGEMTWYSICTSMPFLQARSRQYKFFFVIADCACDLTDT